MSTVLDVNRVDLDHAINHKDHHTDFSEPECLFVRRGQIFTISLHLNSGQYNEGKDTLTITAEIGAQPSENDGTRAVFRVSDAIDEARWGAKASSRTAGVLTLSISSAPSAPIGHYTLFLDQEGQRQVKLGQFVLLYNPWCPRDSVYLDDEDKLEEYVLSQDGLIYVINLALPWIFGQFQQGILDICLKLLGIDPAGVQGCGATGNPVYVTRLLSGLIHKHVLWGNWNDTSDGVNPEEWQSSVEILQRWDMEKSLVRYGQCWVFAAVNCTVSRALGIPCRVIINFDSAHDTDGNLTIDKYVDKYGRPSKETRDSTWNFHCWIESWMTRPDLRPGYGGWQASDPTYLGHAENIGPVPTKAIKDRQLGLQYDARFVFAEVNAKVIVHTKQMDGSTKLVKGYDPVGSKISTKSVCKNEEENITFQYKNDEYIRETKTITLDKPEMKIEISGEQRVGRKLCAEITLQIPLPDTLTGCCFTVEGPDLTGGKCIPERLQCPVPPGKDAKTKVLLTPTQPCRIMLSVKFDSDKLRHVNSFIDVIIGKKIN